MQKKNLFFISTVYVILFILAFSGILLIYSCRANSAYGFEAAEFALKQFFIACGGFACMEYLRRFDCCKLEKLSSYTFFCAMAVLALVLITGVKINGMKGWFSFYSVNLQPSDIFKCFYIFYIANLYEKSQNKEKTFFIAGAVSTVWIGLILLQPDYGTALIYGLIFAVISFLAGVKWYILALLPMCAVTSLAVFVGHKKYGFDRLYNFFAANADISSGAWHWKQFQLTIARGGFFGSKTDGAFWSSNYLPFAYNDSAYAALHELTGFTGAFLLLLLYFVLLAIFFNRGNKLQSGRLFVLSGAFALMVQTLLHCSVNTALLPTTGLTMPLISYGGSSLLGFFLLFGMMLCVCKSNE